LTTYAQ